MDLRTLGRMIVVVGVAACALMAAIFVGLWLFDGADNAATLFWLGWLLALTGACCALSALLDIADSGERRAQLLEALLSRHPAPEKAPTGPVPLRQKAAAIDGMKDFQLPKR